MNEIVINAGRYMTDAQAAEALERSVLDYREDATVTVTIPAVRIETAAKRMAPRVMPR